MTHDYNQLLAKQKEKFITQRAQQEQAFNQWITVCRGWKPEIKQQLPVNVDALTIQILMPCWYAERTTKEEEAEQLKRANDLIEQINQFVDNYNQKSLQLVENFNTIGG